MKKEIIIGSFGSVLSTLSAIGETKEILEIIYTIIAILGAILTFVVMPIVHWYEKAKKDGKITADELKEGVSTLSEGIAKVNEAANNKKKGEGPTEEQ